MEHNIKIEQIRGFPNAEFKVEVSNGETTEHQVTVREAYYEKLTQGSISSYGLIRKAFEFLLEREQNTSILPSFNLEVIERHYPEFEKEVLNADGGGS